MKVEKWGDEYVVISEDKGEVIFKSKDASEAIQYAIDRAPTKLKGRFFEIKEPIEIGNGKILEGKKEGIED